MKLIAVYAILGVLGLILALVSRWWLYRSGKRIGRTEQRNKQLEEEREEDKRVIDEAQAIRGHSSTLDDDELERRLRPPRDIDD